MTPVEEDGWREYRRMILAELERINQSVMALNLKLEKFHAEEISQLRVDIAMLQVKSGIWGGIAGLGVAIGAVAVKYVSGH